MRLRLVALLVLAMMFVFCGCGSQEDGGQQDVAETEATEVQDAAGVEDTTIEITVGDAVLEATLEDNEAARAFAEMMPVTVQMSGYGGFEQVGSLGQSLPADDVQMETEPGDIVLYNGDNVVIFYGSNSWDYTKLGHIDGKSAKELEEILGDGDIEVEFAVKE